MKKIVFLGCENSHSAMFLEFIKNNEKYKDIEVLGVYSHDKTASEKLAEKYSVKAMESYDEAVDKVDGIVITARHGDKHYKYAKPYMKTGVTMFIDKPITVSEEEAVAFMQECKASGVKITGGSCLRFDAWVKELCKDNKEQEDGATLGGIVRCPISINNPNGGFFFYAQHLVETVGVIFGKYPQSVHAYRNGKTLTVVFRYPTYDVMGVFVDESYQCYYAAQVTNNNVKGAQFTVDGKNPCFAMEFDEFYEILSGKEQVASYQDFIAPVFVMNAIFRSMESGKEEKVKEYEIK